MADERPIPQTPRCKNHPDREGMAHYKDDEGVYSLCEECFDRLQANKAEVDYLEDIHAMVRSHA